MLLMGIDIGTTGCKTAVFDGNGVMRALAYRAYSLVFPHKGWMQLNAETVYRAVCECVRECNSATESANALAISCQGEAMIPVDAAGKALYDAIVTFDARSATQTEKLSYSLESEKITEIAGTPVHPMFSVSKLMWLRETKPEIYQKTWKFLCFSGFTALRFGGRPMMDRSMAARTLLYNLRTQKWSQELLNAAGLDKNKLPDIVSSGTDLGEMDAQVATSLGFSNKPHIIAGSHDQSCCALGAGIIGQGKLMCSLGTTESLVCVDTQARVTPEIIQGNIPCGAYVLEEMYIYLAFLSCCGSVLKWFSEQLADNAAFEELDKQAAVLPDAPTSVLVLPYFAGSGTPYLDVKATGLIAGLTLDTGRAEIYKGILESLCMETRLNLSLMESAGLKTGILHCIGGGSKSSYWLQMLADITGKPVTALEIPEAGCLGAAMLAGLAIGAFCDATQAAKQCVREKNTYHPRTEVTSQYSERFAAFSKLYDTAKKITGR